MGTVPVAAHQIAAEVFLFLALALDAIAIAAQSVVGKAIGEGDARLVRSLSDRLVFLGTSAGLLIAALLLAVRPWLGGWFTPEEAVIATLATVYPQLVLVQVLGGAVFAWDGIVIGATDFTWAMLSTLAPAVLTLGWMAGVVAVGGSLVAVWWGIVLLMVLRAGMLGWWHLRRLPTLIPNRRGAV